MLAILARPVFARLFAAQVIALVGSGLLTVALGLLAWDLSGARAGVVLGLVFTVKMVAYVGLAPVMAALTARLPRRAVLVSADVVRAAVALCLPFVDAVWQVYVLIFVLQAASATFTPAFQAVIPDVLTDEADYTRALSLSRLAYDLESLVSPAIAGALLLVAGYQTLFFGTVAGFAASALLILGTPLPPRAGGRDRPFRERLTRGIRIYVATPRLRGLWALGVAAAAVGAFVLVNTVVLVRDLFGGGEEAVALALAAFGAGSMAAALALPPLLDRLPDRPVMIAAAGLAAAAALGTAALAPGWTGVLVAWALIGAGYAAILTPGGRLLRRSAHPEDRPAVFTAQFALSHAGWLVTYPLMGWAGAALGLWWGLALAGGLAAAAAFAATWLWPRDEEVLVHSHPDLPADHPHLSGASGKAHAHPFVIDDEHRVWPSHG